MKLSLISRNLLLLTLLAAPCIANAHPLSRASSDFATGFDHPLSGLDHLLVMIAVGIWALQLGSRASWLMPLSFLSAMCFGGVLAISGVHLPLVETGIVASVFFLGSALIFKVRSPLLVALPLVGLFAIFHGYAHGSEIAGAFALPYSTGFLIGTALLHAAGIFFGIAARRTKFPVLRYAGAVMVVVGVCLSL